MRYAATIVVANRNYAAWDEARRIALIAEIINGEVSLSTACQRHELTTEMVLGWVPEFHRSMMHGLETRLVQTLGIEGCFAERVVGAGYTGTLSDLSLPDLLQTFQMGRKDVVITVARGGERSFLWCEKGELVDAESGRLRGEAAVYRILNFDDGRILADFRHELRARTVESPLQALLLDAARRADDGARLLQQLGGLQGIYEPAPGALGGRTSLAERDVLRMCDGQRAVRDVLEVSELGDLETIATLARLASRGFLLREVASPSPPLAEAESTLAQETSYSIVDALTAPSRREMRALRRRSERMMMGLGIVLGALLWAGVATLTTTASIARANRPALPDCAPHLDVANKAARNDGAAVE